MNNSRLIQLFEIIQIWSDYPSKYFPLLIDFKLKCMFFVFVNNELIHVIYQNPFASILEVFIYILCSFQLSKVPYCVYYPCFLMFLMLYLMTTDISQCFPILINKLSVYFILVVSLVSMVASSLQPNVFLIIRRVECGLAKYHKMKMQF